MKCMSCGAEFADDSVICPVCGQEIQIVPDYNPLDDVLTEQVRGAVSETLKININQEQIDKYRAEQKRNTGNVQGSGRTYQKKVGDGQSVESQNVGTRSRMTEEELERERRLVRRRRAQKKKMLARKRRQIKLIFSGVALTGILALGAVGYVNSYTGRINSGYKKLEAEEYTEAQLKFEKAIKQKIERSEAYTGLAKVYTLQGELEKAEQVFLDAIAKQTDNVDLYEAAILFYLDTDQETKVMELLDKCNDREVLSKLEKYVSDGPKFSLDEKQIYDEVQALELTSDGETIYYTTDGTDPTVSSTKYSAPIKLEEGETEVRAISVNAEGVPSLVVKKLFTVEFPIEDAPSVTPSTGQYDDYQEIKILVPDGYVAFYTTDGSNPTTSETRIQYSGPFDMPEGNTILNVVLMNQKGRYSDITKRTYELILSEE